MATDYISREAVLLNKHVFYHPKDGIARNNGYDPADWAISIGDVMDVPAADVVEVVRCKDCVHFVGMGNIPFLVCEIGRDGSRNYGSDFCSRGVRREP